MRDLTIPYNLRNGEPKGSDELTPWEMSQQEPDTYNNEYLDLIDWEE
jgi:hypothetical protein